MSDQKLFPRMNKGHTQIEANKSRHAQNLAIKWKQCKTLIWRERYVTGRNKHLDKTKQEILNFNSKIWMQNFDNLWPEPHILVFPEKMQKTQSYNLTTRWFSWHAKKQRHKNNVRKDKKLTIFNNFF